MYSVFISAKYFEFCDNEGGGGATEAAVESQLSAIEVEQVESGLEGFCCCCCFP
jgi:hypothetical protein